MDMSGLMDSKNFGIVQTTDGNSWTYVLDKVTVGSINIPFSSFMTISFDPMVPYVYLPTDLWMTYAKIMKDYYRDGITCDEFRGICNFEEPCKDLDTARSRHDLVLFVKDYEDNQISIKLNTFEIVRQGLQEEKPLACFVTIIMN